MPMGMLDQAMMDSITIEVARMSGWTIERLLPVATMDGQSVKKAAARILLEIVAPVPQGATRRFMTSEEVLIVACPGRYRR